MDLSFADGRSSPPFLALGALVVMSGALALLAFRPSRLAIVLYLVLGTTCVYLYLHGMLDGHIALLPAALVIINRPATALVLVGTIGSRPLPAVAWGLGGFLAGAGRDRTGLFSAGHSATAWQCPGRDPRQLLRGLPRSLAHAARPAPEGPRLPEASPRRRDASRPRAPPRTARSRSCMTPCSTTSRSSSTARSSSTTG
ncbi:MAG: hypothetical protein WDM88_01105 [Galbitalea sp.]